MATNLKTNLKVTELDFDGIKSNLKEYLKGQEIFRDYDFEGAAITTLLDLLAYFQFYQGIHANMAMGEVFLDTAILRSSAVSRAKELGFTPRGWTAPYAKLRIGMTFLNNDEAPNPAIIEKGTKFKSTVAGSSYTFSTVEAVSVYPDDDGLYETELDVYQGDWLAYQYIVDESDPLQRFLIPNANTDTRFMKVSVKGSVSETEYETYTLSDDITVVGPDDLVYYLQESYDGFPEIYFGDGILGKKVGNGSVIRIEYILTQGGTTNGARNFAQVSDIAGADVVSIEAIETAGGGAGAQEIDEIKLLAPRLYQAQKRGVTSEDYYALLKNDYPNIEDISVWGGEDNLPIPYYGKVFIAIKPKQGYIFSNTLKETIKKDILNKYRIVSIRPEIVDPDYTYVAVQSTVNYNPRKTTKSSGELTAIVLSAIKTFFRETTNKFGKNLQYSRLIAAIDDSESSIISNTTRFKLQKRFTPTSGSATDYYFYYNNPLNPGSIVATKFMIDGYEWEIRDVPIPPGPHSRGRLQIYRTDTLGDRIVLNDAAGTIDYINGEVVLKNFSVDSIPSSTGTDGEIWLTVSPLKEVGIVERVDPEFNIVVNERNQLLALEEDDITITMKTTTSVV